MNQVDDLAVVDDRLDGAVEIARFTGDPVWRVYAKAAAGTPGIYKEGRRLFGSKAVLVRHHYQQAGIASLDQTDTADHH